MSLDPFIYKILFGTRSRRTNQRRENHSLSPSDSTLLRESTVGDWEINRHEWKRIFYVGRVLRHIYAAMLFIILPIYKKKKKSHFFA